MAKKNNNWIWVVAILVIVIFGASIFGTKKEFPGTCVPNWDTDGGNIPTTKGTLTFVSTSGTELSLTDECLVVGGKAHLLEYYCSSTTPLSIDITCANGCVNGACINSPSTGSCSSPTASANKYYCLNQGSAGNNTYGCTGDINTNGGWEDASVSCPLGCLDMNAFYDSASAACKTVTTPNNPCVTLGVIGDVGQFICNNNNIYKCSTSGWGTAIQHCTNGCTTSTSPSNTNNFCPVVQTQDCTNPIGPAGGYYCINQGSLGNRSFGCIQGIWTVSGNCPFGCLDSNKLDYTSAQATCKTSATYACQGMGVNGNIGQYTCVDNYNYLCVGNGWSYASFCEAGCSSEKTVSSTTIACKQPSSSSSGSSSDGSSSNNTNVTVTTASCLSEPECASEGKCSTGVDGCESACAPWDKWDPDAFSKAPTKKDSGCTTNMAFIWGGLAVLLVLILLPKIMKAGNK